MQLEQFMLVIKIQLKLLFVHLNILHTSEQLLTLFRMGFFRAAHGWGGGRVVGVQWREKVAPPSNLSHFFFFYGNSIEKKKSITCILQWWNLAVIPYLNKIQKIYESRDSLLEFCWHQHFSPETFAISRK